MMHRVVVLCNAIFSSAGGTTLPDALVLEWSQMPWEWKEGAGFPIGSTLTAYRAAN